MGQQQQTAVANGAAVRRLLLVLLVAALMAAMAVAMAAPAFADAKSGTAPNCESGQLTSNFNQAVNPSDNDNPGKHLNKFFGCVGR